MRWFVRTLAAAALVVPAAPAAAAQDRPARVICLEEMAGERGARNIRDVRQRRIDGQAYIYGTADFGDAQAIRFRCQVRGSRLGRTAFRPVVDENQERPDWASEVPGARGEPEPDAPPAPVEEGLPARPRPKFQSVRAPDAASVPAEDKAAQDPPAGERAEADSPAAEVERPPGERTGPRFRQVPAEPGAAGGGRFKKVP